MHMSNETEESHAVISIPLAAIKYIRILDGAVMHCVRMVPGNGFIAILALHTHTHTRLFLFGNSVVEYKLYVM